MDELFKPACCQCTAPYRNSNNGVITILQCTTVMCNRFMHPGCTEKGMCCDKPLQVIRHGLRVGKRKYKFIESTSAKKTTQSTIPSRSNPSLDKSFCIPTTGPADEFNATMESLSRVMGGTFSVTKVTTSMATSQATTTTTAFLGNHAKRTARAKRDRYAQFRSDG